MMFSIFLITCDKMKKKVMFLEKGYRRLVLRGGGVRGKRPESVGSVDVESVRSG